MNKLISSKVFFNSINSNLRVIGIGTKTLYNITDINNELGYKCQGYLKKYYSYNCQDIKIINDEYTDIFGINTILNRGRKPNCKKLLQEILTHSKINYQFVMSERIKDDILKSVQDYYLDDSNIVILSNQYVKGLHTFIIMKKNNHVKLFIDINEKNNSFRDKKTERVESIKMILRCDNYLNINPNDVNFSIGKLIKNITEYV